VPLFVCVLLLAALNGCEHPRTVEKAQPEVVFTGGGGELRVKVELARTEAERERGLMFRQSLPPGTGMLFLFPHPERLKFWMKNTYIPLDMVFLDANRRVIAIEENAQPLSLNPRGPDQDAKYVVEVPGGWARSHGISPGIDVRFTGFTYE
jgi:uncharacterized membrane protein (UPF0127 family)